EAALLRRRRHVLPKRHRRLRRLAVPVMLRRLAVSVLLRRLAVSVRLHLLRGIDTNVEASARKLLHVHHRALRLVHLLDLRELLLIEARVARADRRLEDRHAIDGSYFFLRCATGTTKRTEVSSSDTFTCLLSVSPSVRPA